MNDIGSNTTSSSVTVMNNNNHISSSTCTPPTVATVASSSSLLSLISIPKDVLLHILLRPFLVSHELMTIGSTSMLLLELTQQCDLINVVMGLAELIRDRREADSLFADLPERQQKAFMQKFPTKVNLDEMGGRKEKSPIELLRSINTQKYQIGQITAIDIQATYGNEILKHLLVRLHLLPESIKSIRLRASIRWYECRFPSSLTRLHLSDSFHAFLEGVKYPPTLRELIFSRPNSMHRPLPSMLLPDSLRLLHIHDGWNPGSLGLGSHKFPLPESLTDLMLPEFTQSINNLQLPPRLRILRLKSSFNEPAFEHLKLPDSLTELDLRYLNRPLFMRSWITPPPSLTLLQCQSSCPLSGDPPIQLTNALFTFTFTLPPPMSPNHHHAQPVSLTPIFASTSSSSELLSAPDTPAPAPINFRAHLTHIHIDSNNPNLSDIAGGVLYPSLTSIVLTGEVASLRNFFDWSALPQLHEMIFHISTSQPQYLTTTNPVRFPPSVRRLEFHHSYPIDTMQHLQIELPPQLECLNCNGTASYQWIAKPPKVQLPRTIRRIELLQANDDWLSSDVPSTCIFYEKGKNGRYRQVPIERIEVARQQHRLNLQTAMFD